MDDETDLFFRSRIDLPYALILGIAAIVLLASGGALLAVPAPMPPAIRYASLLAVSLSLLLVGDILLRTHYGLTSNGLTVRSGPFQQRIPLAQLAGCRRVVSPISAPALSFRRVRVYYHRKRSWCGSDHAYVDVSPKEERAFISALRRLCRQRRGLGASEHGETPEEPHARQVPGESSL